MLSPQTATRKAAVSQILLILIMIYLGPERWLRARVIGVGGWGVWGRGAELGNQHNAYQKTTPREGVEGILIHGYELFTESWNTPKPLAARVAHSYAR